MPQEEVEAAGEAWAAEGQSIERPAERLAHALRNRRFRRLGGGTLHTAAFRTPGNKRWPAPLDDLNNSLLTTFFRSPWLGRGVLIGPFLETRLDLNH